MKLSRLICLTVISVLIVATFTGCTKRHQRHKTKASSDANVSGEATNPSDIDDVVVIADIDHLNYKLALKDIDSEWTYHVVYDDDTTFTSRYGEQISPDQLIIGEIAEVDYNIHTYRLSNLKISLDAWVYEDVKGLTYNQTDETISIMGETYPYNNSLVLRDETIMGQETLDEIAKKANPTTEDTTELDIIKDKPNKKKDKVNPIGQSGGNVGDGSGDRPATTEEPRDTDEDEDDELVTGEREVKNNLNLSAIDPCDTVTCWGYKGLICSVILNSGHGYVRFSSYSTYLGGMVAIGDVIAPVTEDMVLTVPEGEWTLEIDKNGKMGTKDIIVAQNQDQTVNLASLMIIANKKGILHFITDPADCTIIIDNVEYTGKTNFSLDYGLHKVQVVAVDYKAYNGTIYVNTAFANVNVKLVKIDDKDESDLMKNDSLFVATTKAKATTTEQIEEVTTTEAANNLEQQ